MSDVVIIATGVANTASVAAAMRRRGLECTITDDAERVASAGLVVLPGVGSFAAGMEALGSRGLIPVIRNRVDQDRPLLAICLGLQLLCCASEESPGVQGIGAIDATVTRFPDGVRIPQFGWNAVNPTIGASIPAGFAYFANSYRLAEIPAGWAGATAVHGGPFVAAIERGSVLACQFHPELSGRWGAALIDAWVTRGAGAATC